MSLYYTTPSDPANYSVGRSSVIRAQFAALSAGFDLLPDPDEINQSRVTWCLDTGTANTILLDPPTRPAGYVIGLTIKFKALAANTGPTTVNVMGASAVLLGAKSLLRADGTVLATGDIVANQVCEITYDGTSFRLSMAFAEMSPAGVAAKVAAAGAVTVNGALTATGVVTGAKFVSTGFAEGLRIADGSPFLSFYNSAQTISFGQIVHTGAGMAIDQSVAAGDLTLNTAAGGTVSARVGGVLVSSVNDAGLAITGSLSVSGNGVNAVTLPSLGNFANDAAASAGGVGISGLYRNGSVLMIRAA